MDPTANLAEQLSLAESIIDDSDEWLKMAAEPDDERRGPLKDWNPDPDDAVRLAELVIALDEWITKGGFLPNKWRDQPPRVFGRVLPS